MFSVFYSLLFILHCIKAHKVNFMFSCFKQTVFLLRLSSYDAKYSNCQNFDTSFQRSPLPVNSMLKVLFRKFRVFSR